MPAAQPIPATHSGAFLGRRDVVPRPSAGIVRPSAPRVPAAIVARPGAPPSVRAGDSTRGPAPPLLRTPAEMERRNAAAVTAATNAAASSNWMMLKDKAAAQQKNAIINA